MASRSDLVRRGGCLLVVLAGCRPQALPEPPQHADAADPEAPASEVVAPASLQRSAFEGVKLGGGGHAGHGGHGRHGKKKAESQPETTHEDAADASDHEGHE